MGKHRNIKAKQLKKIFKARDAASKHVNHNVLIKDIVNYLTGIHPDSVELVTKRMIIRVIRHQMFK